MSVPCARVRVELTIPDPASTKSVRVTDQDPLAVIDVLPAGTASTPFACSAPPVGAVVSTRTVVEMAVPLPTRSVPVRV